MAKQRIDNFLGGTIRTELGYDEMSYTQNMYFESKTDGGITKNILKGIEGMRMKYPLTGTPRGAFVTSTGPDGEPRLFVVKGRYLYAIDRLNPEPKNLGEIGGNGLVSMCETGGETPWLCIAYGDGIAVCSITLAVPVVENIELPVKIIGGDGGESRPIRPSYITYQFGYLTCNDQDTDFFYRSYQYPFEQLNSETGELEKRVFTYDPMTEEEVAGGMYIPSDWKPDVTTCLVSTNATLFTFGPKSMQLFKYTGDANMPFNSPDTSALAIGILAEHSAACIGNKVFWLGSSDVGQFGVYMTSDVNPTRISHPDMEREIMEMKDPGDALGFCWTFAGHTFYALTFHTDRKTYVYDLSTGLWHNRVSTDPETGENNDWRYKMAFLFDNSVCFLCDDGVVEIALNRAQNASAQVTGIIAPSWREHDGNPIVRLRRGGAIVDGFTPFCIDNVQFKVYNRMPMALSLSTERPKCRFRYSKNGEAFDNSRVGSLGRVNTLGLSGTKDITGILGKCGEFGFVTQFPRLGIGSSFTFELSCSEDIPFDIVGCVINWTPVSRGF